MFVCTRARARMYVCVCVCVCVFVCVCVRALAIAREHLQKHVRARPCKTMQTLEAEALEIEKRLNRPKISICAHEAMLAWQAPLSIHGVVVVCDCGLVSLWPCTTYIQNLSLRSSFLLERV